MFIFRKTSDDDDNDDGDKSSKKLKAMIANSICSTTFNVTYNDIVGLEDVKAALEESVIFPLKYPSLMQSIGEWKGILLFGVSVTKQIIILFLMIYLHNFSRLAVERLWLPKRLLRSAH